MHLRILPDQQNLFFKKDIFYCLEWLKTFFDAFAHTSRPPKLLCKKDIFYWLEWLKTCFDAFAHTPRPLEICSEKRYFWPSGVFWCICAYSQTTRNCFFKKDIFYWLEWLKTCFDAFAHTPRPPETFFQKRYFLLNGVVKNVF